MEELLLEAGLTRNEAKVYGTLLNTGPLRVRVLARRCKIYRSCVYDALDQLAKKGLVSFLEKKNTRWYQAAEPQSLLTWIQEKEIVVKNLLPRLKLEINLKKETPSKTCVWEGLKAFRQILYSWLEKKSSILVYGIPATVPALVKYFIEAFHKERARKKIWMKHIYNRDALDRAVYLNTLPYTEAKCFPKTLDSPSSTMICKDEILLITWEPLTLIRIENEGLAQAYQRYFEILWVKARKPRKK